MKRFLLAGLALCTFAPAQLPVHPGPRWASMEKSPRALYDHENRPKLSGNTFLFTRVGDRVGEGIEPRTLLTFTSDAIIERGVATHDRWPIQYVNRSEFSVPGLKILEDTIDSTIGYFPEKSLKGFQGLLTSVSEDLRFGVYGSLAEGDDRLILNQNGMGIVGFLRPLKGDEVERFASYIHELDRMWLVERDKRLRSQARAPELRLAQTFETRVLGHIYHGEFNDVRRLLEPRAKAFTDLWYETLLDTLFVTYQHTFSYLNWNHEDRRGRYSWLVHLAEGPRDTLAAQVSPPIEAEDFAVYIEAFGGRVGALQEFEYCFPVTFVNAFVEFHAVHGGEDETVKQLEENLRRLVQGKRPVRLARPAGSRVPAGLDFPWQTKAERRVENTQEQLAYTVPAGCEVGWIQDHGEQSVRLLVGEFGAFTPYAVEISAIKVEKALRNPMAVFNRALSIRGHETGMFVEDTDAIELTVGGSKAYWMEINELILVVVLRENEHWILTLNRWKKEKGPYESIFREFVDSVEFEVKPTAASTPTPSSFAKDTSTHRDDAEFFAKAGHSHLQRRELRQAESWFRKAAELEVSDAELYLAAFLLGLESGLEDEKATNARKRSRPVRVKHLFEELNQLSGQAVEVPPIENIVPSETFVYRDFLAGRSPEVEATQLLRPLAQAGSAQAMGLLKRAGIPLEETVVEAPPSQAELNAKTENPVQLFEALNEGVDAPVPALFRSESGLAYICGKDSSGTYRLEQIPYKRIADAVADFLAENPGYPAAQYVPFYKGQFAGLAFALDTFPHEYSTIEDVTEAARKAPLKSAWAPYGPVNKGRTNARIDEDVILAAALAHASNRERPLFFKKRDSTRRIYLAHHHELQGGQQYVLVHELHHDELVEHLDIVEATIAASGSFWGKSADEQLAIILNNNDAARIALERWPELYPSLRELLEAAASCEVRKDFFR